MIETRLGQIAGDVRRGILDRFILAAAEAADHR